MESGSAARTRSAVRQVGGGGFQRGERLARHRARADGAAGRQRAREFPFARRGPGSEQGDRRGGGGSGAGTAARTGRAVHQYSFHWMIWGCMPCLRATTSMVRVVSSACPDADDPHGRIVDAQEGLQLRRASAWLKPRSAAASAMLLMG